MDKGSHFHLQTSLFLCTRGAKRTAEMKWDDKICPRGCDVCREKSVVIINTRVIFMDLCYMKGAEEMVMERKSSHP